jgi:N-acetylglucosaminyl-diphospho-decaprenol L-rhamnosyltransferase
LTGATLEHGVKLAIVIVHYNTSSDLARCLESLAAYQPACAHEIVVVDNASVDLQLPSVRERFPAVRWILNAENVGYARGGNQGMAAVAADYYLLLNPDTVAQPGALDSLLAFADAHPKAGIVGPQLLNEDGSVQDSCRRFYTFVTLLLRRTFLGRIFRHSRSIDRHLMRDFDHRSAQPVDWVLGGCLLVRRAAMERTGPMDERFFLYFEDVDWCFRMWQAGWEVLYTPAARFIHRHRRESARGALHRSFWRHLGSLISFYEKWGLLIYLLKKWRRPLSVFLLWLLDMIALAAAFGLAYGLRVALNPAFAESLYPWVEYRPLIWFAQLLTTVTFWSGGRYRLARAREATHPGLHLRRVGTVSLLLLASTYLSHQQVYSRAVLLLFIPLFALASFLGEAFFRALGRRMERGYLSLERTLLVGEPAVLRLWLEKIQDVRSLGVDPVGYVGASTAAASAPSPPLARGDVPWLGAWSDLLSIVEKYRISQVVFWGLPPTRPDGLALLARLRRRRIRLRWCADEAWLLASRARAELFAGQISAVLEPGTVSLLRITVARLGNAAAGCLLALLSGGPYLALRLSPRGRRVVNLTGLDACGEPVNLRVACDGTGRVLPLGWQWPLAKPLLSGRLGVWGPPLRAVATASEPPARPPLEFWRAETCPCGLTGRWVASAAAEGSTVPSWNRQSVPAGARWRFFQPLATWRVLLAVVRRLWRNPAGLRNVTESRPLSSPEMSHSLTQREVL